MDISEIRHKNLLGILATGMTQRAFAERVGSSKVTISQYVCRNKRSNGGLMSIGSELARRIENSFGMEYGAMDQLQDWSAAPAMKGARVPRVAGKPAAAWLITGGSTHPDTVALTMDEAANEILHRRDGSVMEPLFRAGAGKQPKAPPGGADQ